MNCKELMNRAADNIRILSVSMVENAKSGHPGGAMGGADFINVLFSEFLVYDPDQPLWAGRDRFYLDPGHMSPMLYSALTLQGKFTIEDIKQFRQWGSITPGHPERDLIHGVENSSGPLGQGHAYAAGAAVAEKFLAARLSNTMMQHKIYAYISDGGIQEGISAEVGRLAGNLGLNNLIMFYDANDVQLSTTCGAVSCEDTAMRYRSYNWNVLTINGNDVDEIREALIAANKETERPTLIIGNTIMAKGGKQADGSSYEGSVKTHGAPFGTDAYINTVKNLGGNPDDPFVVFDDVQKLYDDRKAELRTIVAKRHAEEEAWRKANPTLAAQMGEWFAEKAPKIDWSQLQQKRDIPSRNASAACLGVLAEQVPNMIVASADLSNSDKTDGFLNKTHSLTRGDFSGAFFQAGVSELAMGCMCIGMMLHGGVITAMGTFFVFSDYMKPAIRMAALMQVPVKFIWSHDAFRVGEDGPTHEPVEHEAQIRLMEKLQNHAGKDSVRVFRPADSDATTVCWQMAMENMETPTALILSRQNIKSLPEGNNYEEVRKGAYIVKGSDEQFDVILLASGSEVSTLVEAAEPLRKAGYKVRIVSVPSEGLFRRQSKEYQEQVLPKGAKIFGLTAGLPVTLEGLVGAEGSVYGLPSFGFSAPFKVLDEKLGFTPENIFNEVKKYISK
ncbi:transketolase [uncultured Prevotella sp.]|uniref:transketolase family protein n=1 Tax=uncultured Prevotella sp. TaxID=159272 RepID=UPI002587F06B|nr:transketolase [uncultured Prevotella sp.]